MSWSLGVPPTPKEAFADAVDAAEPTGQELTLPGVTDDVAAAREALKALGQRAKRPVVAGYANGHALQAQEGDTWSDSIAVSVHGQPQAT